MAPLVSTFSDDISSSLYRSQSHYKNSQPYIPSSIFVEPLYHLLPSSKYGYIHIYINTLTHALSKKQTKKNNTLFVFKGNWNVKKERSVKIFSFNFFMKTEFPLLYITHETFVSFLLWIKKKKYSFSQKANFISASQVVKSELTRIFRQKHFEWMNGER